MGTCDAFRMYVEDILHGGEFPVEEQSTFKFKLEKKIMFDTLPYSYFT